MWCSVAVFDKALYYFSVEFILLLHGEIDSDTPCFLIC